MLKRILGFRPSPAMLVALLALIVAAPGGAVAASLITGKQVKNGTITSADLKNGSATGKDVKDRSIGPADLSSSAQVSGPRGPVGPQGPGGARGTDGARGPEGPFPSTLPSGKTITGAYGISDGTAAGGGEQGSDWGVDSISFTYPLASEPTVQVRRTSDPATAQCPGSAAAPSATPGHLCVYEGDSGSIDAQSPDTCRPNSPNCALARPSLRASRYGAIVRIFGTATTRFYSWGSWAVTAP